MDVSMDVNICLYMSISLYMEYGCEYMDGTRGSGVVSSADDVLKMSMVRGVRAVCGVLKCVCVWIGAGWEVWW